MKKIFLGALSILLIMISGCKKDEQAYEQYLVVGDLSSSNLIYIDIEPDEVIAAQPGERSYKYFDINDDGINDFIITSNHGIGPPDTMDWKDCGIYALTENFQVSSEDIPDSMVQYSEFPNNSIEVIHLQNYNPSIHPDSILYSWQKNRYPKIYSSDETISNTSVWNSGKPFTRQRIRSQMANNIQAEEHTRWGKWNGLNTKYVGFKLSKSEETFYGWIRIDVRNYKDVVVYEYAYKRVAEE